MFVMMADIQLKEGAAVGILLVPADPAIRLTSGHRPRDRRTMGFLL